MQRFLALLCLLATALAQNYTCACWGPGLKTPPLHGFTAECPLDDPGCTDYCTAKLDIACPEGQELRGDRRNCWGVSPFCTKNTDFACHYNCVKAQPEKRASLRAGRR